MQPCSQGCSQVLSHSLALYTFSDFISQPSIIHFSSQPQIFSTAARNSPGNKASSFQSLHHAYLLGIIVCLSVETTIFVNINPQTSFSGHSQLSGNEAMHHCYHIAGNFRGEKLLRILRLVAICESFLCKIWAFGAAKVNNLRKFSPRKLYFSQICESFLPRKYE